jgi:predicted DNA-binding transcriptional regulator AlpA
MSDKIFLPESGLIRLPDVLKLIPVGKSTWWHGTSTGRFPKPIKLGKRISAWRVEDIRALIENPHISLPFKKEV